MINENIKEFIYEDILPRVEKPGRYVGNEWNSIHKSLDGINIRFAFGFPDVYEVGMSHLGIKILYHLLNEQKDIYCERVFAPWPDMEKEMRAHNVKLFALESRDYIDQFDFIGFTLQYEMSYTNIINMIDLAGLPVRSNDRKEGQPFVIAGGPCAYNPEPLAGIVDLFAMGEGEELILEIMDAYRLWKSSGKSRAEFLRAAARIKGVYVPSLYKVEYNADDTIKQVVPLDDTIPKKVQKRIVKSLEQLYFPDKIIVPYIEIVHDRIILEIFRGCTRGCRFCQAGMVYRPVREREIDELVEIADKLLASTGYEEISLSSLSTGDYSRLQELVEKLMSKYESSRVALSLPSLRLDSFTLKLIEEIQKVRKSGLTFAPEAGTQRMRDIINKGVTEEDLMTSVGSAFETGYSGIKLYFMIGLPTETMEDIDGIVDLACKVLNCYYNVPIEKRPKNLSLNVAASSFVPKAFTPFQWVPQDRIETLIEKQKHLRAGLKKKKATVNWHEPQVSYMEAVFARGDRRLNEVLIKAWELGCKFDGWDEHFRFSKWVQAFQACDIDPEFYAYRQRELDEILPWDHIDVGVTKDYLISEYKKSLNAKLTEDCKVACTGCGINLLEEGGVCK